MNQKIVVSWLLLGMLFGLSGCTIMSPKPLGTFGAAELARQTNYTRDLDNLPPPKVVLPVAVYGFKDQSGQYKPQPDSSFSTAVSQGGTAMLIKALKDSGWFAAVERENIQDVLTERKIVRAIEQPGDKPGEDTKIKLPTLIGAGMVLEGSVIGFDENVKTGGVGFKWLGLNLSDQYRVDQVSVNLRAVDIGSGLVMESVTTTKTVYSAQLDTGEYRYVNYQSLLEVELGTSLNEPGQIALQEAIEAAVVNLVVEGIADRKWQLKSDADKDSPLFKKYRNAQTARSSRMAPVSRKGTPEPVPETPPTGVEAVTPWSASGDDNTSTPDKNTTAAPGSSSTAAPAGSKAAAGGLPAPAPVKAPPAVPAASVGPRSEPVAALDKKPAALAPAVSAAPAPVNTPAPWSAVAEDSAAAPDQNRPPVAPVSSAASTVAPASGVNPAPVAAPASGASPATTAAPAAGANSAPATSASWLPPAKGSSWLQTYKVPALGQRL
jgi:curli production assembly/transport component CsgG